MRYCRRCQHWNAQYQRIYISTSSYCGAALLFRRPVHHQGTRPRVQQNDLPTHNIHSIKLVAGPLGQFVHMMARAFYSDRASAPEGRSIREFFEQVVIILHGSPLSGNPSFRRYRVRSGNDVQFIDLMASISFASFRQVPDGEGGSMVTRPGE